MFEGLRPCPFCGGKARLFVNYGVRVICPNCGASTKTLVDSMRVASNATRSVIEAWNRGRVPNYGASTKILGSSMGEVAGNTAGSVNWACNR